MGEKAPVGSRARAHTSVGNAHSTISVALPRSQVIDATNGALHFKGSRTLLAPPRERVMRRGEARTPLLKSGSRLNVIVNMATREMHIELLAPNSNDPWALSTLEVQGLPHEVAVCVGLGPSKGESVVRLAGCKTELSDSCACGARGSNPLALGARICNLSRPFSPRSYLLPLLCRNSCALQTTMARWSRIYGTLRTSSSRSN